MSSFGYSIELEEDCVLTLEVDIDYTFTPGERQTYDDPGCDELAELDSVRVTQFLGGTKTIIRNKSNEIVFVALDAAAEELIENRWEDELAELACENYNQGAWDDQAAKYE